MPEVLQSVLTPLAILVGVAVYYRILSQGLEQMRKTSQERMERDDKRHAEVWPATTQKWSPYEN